VTALTAASVSVSGHDLFTEHECAELRDRVLDSRAHWITRGLQFYTLGAASYLDAAVNREQYDTAVARLNPVLTQDFADVYARLVDFFQGLLRQPVSVDSDLALPGFHVFEFGGRYRDPLQIVERAHFDLQWTLLRPADLAPQTMSFTVPIELPSGGGAMQLWNARYRELVCADVAAREYAGAHSSRRLAYGVGHAVLHDGLILHAIGESLTNRPCGERITLQGHLMREGDAWVMYW
jgi:hypothetical protein